MNLTWHIVKKDLVRMRLPVLVWAVFLSVQVVVSDRLLSIRSVDYTWFANMGMLLNLLAAVGLLASFILAAALVLDDPLAGPDPSWVTRPISGGRLLRAKLLWAVLVFGLIPVLLWVPWWLYCDFTLGEMVYAAGRVLCVQASAVISGFVLASLAGQAGRFVLFSVLVLAASLVAVMNFVTWTGAQALGADLLQTRLLLATGLLLVAGAAVVGRQYLTRRLVSSAALLTVGVILAGSIVLWWPWNLVNLRPENGTQMARSEGITAEIHEVRVAALGNTTGPENIGVLFQVLFKGVPDDVSVASGQADLELRWPDGTSLQRSSLRMRPDYWSDQNERAAVLTVLGVSLKHDWLNHWDPETEAKHAAIIAAGRPRTGAEGRYWREQQFQPGTARLTLTLAVTDEMAAKISAEHPACAIFAHFTIRKPALLIEMPLKGDTWAAGNGARLHVLNLSPNTWRGMNHEPVKVFLTTVVAASAPDLTGLSLYTVDRTHGTATFQGRTSSFSAVSVAAASEGLYFSVLDPRLWRTDQWVDAPGWLESARLAALTDRDVGGFDREFHLDRITILKDRGE
jgi:hypothetical protein